MATQQSNREIKPVHKSIAVSIRAPNSNSQTVRAVVQGIWYDVEHTQSVQTAVDDTYEVCVRNGGRVP